MLFCPELTFFLDKINHRETDEMIAARAYEFFAWLHDRSERNIAVITHSAFLSVLFNKVVTCNSDMSRWFENCEMRTTQFTLVEPPVKKGLPN